MININTRKQALLFMLMLPFMSGCASILSTQVTQTTYYSLDSTHSKASTENDLNTVNNTLPTLVVNRPKASAGSDTRRMMYTRSQYQLEYFARSEWVDTPSHMLQPLIVSAIEKTHSFSAVVPKLPAAKTDLRLESEMLSLLQDFNTKPSTVRFTLRATIINNATGQVVALRQFDERENAMSDDPIGGVKSANKAVNIVLGKLGLFCAETAANWKR
ncbi:MAG: ABC-type transport auxiliary lipoprotein family protein [Methylophilus sp.]